jgi:hypothetical protein
MRRKKFTFSSQPVDVKGTKSRKILTEDYNLAWEEQITNFKNGNLTKKISFCALGEYDKLLKSLRT